MVKQFESPHSKANNESSLKHQNIVDTKLSKKINSKKLIDNLINDLIIIQRLFDYNFVFLRINDLF